ncbi:MAG: hypothetical protein ACRC6M_11410 [Microcystaceae cyanobacterium]
MPSSSSSNGELDRQMRSFNRRIERLEDTQITNQELNRAFDRIYDEIDDLTHKVDNLQSEFQHFRQQSNEQFQEVNGKLDTILKHLTGIN